MLNHENNKSNNRIFPKIFSEDNIYDVPNHVDIEVLFKGKQRFGVACNGHNPH